MDCRRLDVLKRKEPKMNEYGTGDRELLTPKDVEQHTKLCAQLAEFPYQLVQMVRRFRKTFQSTIQTQEDNPNDPRKKM